MSEPATAVRPGPAWHRSLYWRIAIGFIGFLAVVLLAQTLLFVWLAGRNGGLFPAASSARLAELVASDLRDELERDPLVDLQAHIAREHGRIVQAFVVVLADGRALSNRAVVPPALQRIAQNLLMRLVAGRRIPRRLGPDGRGFFAPIVVGGGVAGLVAVPPGPPPLAGTLQALGPTLALSGAVLLCLGAAMTAALIGGPVRRRLGQLEDAARRIGAGDVTARAPEYGGDEVASLARSFNRMAADLQARADALASSDRLRRQLLADVSHELMTPLTAMRGYIETLTMAELQIDPPMRERYLRIVDEETRRLERIIGDLLDLARLEGAAPTLRREPVAVASLFERVAARHERELRNRRVTLARGVEAGAETVMGDPDRLEQALQNLAANALRHTPDAGTLTMTASPAGRGIRLTVRDTGSGIPPEHLPFIFDRFYKADAARASGGNSRGSGLGLSIVRSIVEAHRGTIAARNENGAVFEIDLPRDPAA